MSIPISACRVWKLAREGTDAEVKKFAADLSYNKRMGIWTQVPCRCTPPCLTPTDDQLRAFELKVNVYMADERTELLSSRTDIARPPVSHTILFPRIASVMDVPVLANILSVQPMTEPNSKTNRATERACDMKPGTLKP